MQSYLFINLDDLVSEDHIYRKILKILNFKKLTRSLEKLRKNEFVGRKGYSIEQGFKMLLVQFMEDLSDRELEKYMRENLPAKLFCGFNIKSNTPDHSYFGHLRKSIGTKNLSIMFNKVRKSLKREGFIPEVFTFIDASHLVSKFDIWKDRDKLIADGEKAFNNAVIEVIKKKSKTKITADKDARFGSKSKSKYWFGYKRHVSVDMQSGLINKIASSPGNLTDGKGLKMVCPSSGAVVADKGYCSKATVNVIKSKGCYDMTIKKLNMKNKNKDKDSWISHLRSPYERVFSQMERRTRYRGQAKVQFQVYMEAMAFNLKRLIKLDLKTELALS